MELRWRNTHGLSEGNIALRAQSLRAYTKTMNDIRTRGDWSAVEASLLLPDDPETLAAVKALVAEKVGPELRYIIVIGIGGSNLGTQALYDALEHTYTHPTSERPVILFIDTTNPVVLRHHIEQVLPTIQSLDEVLLVSISKSGGTTETIANTEILLDAYGQAFGEYRDRLVVITDTDSPYAAAAYQAGVATLSIPPMVGGRYSVLSAVGLFPLCALGLEVDQLCRGAADMLQDCLYDDWEHNPAVQSAAITALWYESGKTVSDTFLFHSELESLGKWYRQLLGESVGKAETVHGRTRPTGLVPTVSIGSTDLHSVGQLYLGGPSYSLTTFVYSSASEGALTVPNERVFPDIAPMVSGKNTHDIMSAIRRGTMAAYQKQSRPYMEVVLDAIAPYELGAFMQFKMCEMMFLGKLLSVNPFNQPNVELYKSETRRILEE